MNAILLCRTREVPTLGQIAEELCRGGFDAFVEIGNPPGSTSADIRYAPGKMPIVVKFDNDLYDEPDEKDYEYFDWMKELVPDSKEREGVRRFVFVDAMQNVDAKAFQVVTDYLRVQTNAVVITQEQIDAL